MVTLSVNASVDEEIITEIGLYMVHHLKKINLT